MDHSDDKFQNIVILHFEFDVVEQRSYVTVKVNGATPRALLGVNVVSIDNYSGHTYDALTCHCHTHRQ